MNWISNCLPRTKPVLIIVDEISKWRNPDVTIAAPITLELRSTEGKLCEEAARITYGDLRAMFRELYT